MTFDLERERANVQHYTIENPDDCDTDCGLGDLVRQANLAEEALAEIERLRADLADSEKRNEDLRKSIDDLSTTIFSGAQAARITELESLNEDLMKNCNGLRTRAQKAEAQNRLLKEKLIEKLGQLFHQFGDLELDPPGGVDRKFARDQLRAEMPEVFE